MVGEVGLRLSLKGRRETAAGLAATEAGLDDVKGAAKDVEKAGEGAARGLAKASAQKFGRGFLSIARGGSRVVGVIGRGIMNAARMGAVGLGILTAAAAGASLKAIGLAGDARETASAFNTVFGPSARGIAKELGRLTHSFGLYNPELKDATRQFGVFGKAAGIANKDLPKFSTSLVKAGLDLSSFYNTDPGETFQALQSGLSGEAEPLRKFGIFISAATLEAKAATMGLTGELTEQQKVMVRQKIIMSSLGDAQGDMARTSKGFANQQRGATGRIKTFFTMIGGPLTTAATGAFKGFNAMAKSGIRELRTRLPGLEKGAKGLSRTFEKWGRTMADKVPGALDRIAASGAKVGDFFSRVRTFTTGIDWGNTSSGLAGIGTSMSGIDWGALADGVGQGVSDSVSVFGVVIGFAADHVDTLAKYLPLLIGAFAAYKAAQTVANVVGLAHVPILAAQIGANLTLASANRALAVQMGIANGVEKVGVITRARATAGMLIQKGATLAVSAATKVWAAGQWLLNAALTANPIGLVVVAIAALVGGLILAYKKSETFRGIIDGLWNNVLKPFGKFIGGIFVGYIRILAKAWLTMGIFGIKAFRWLLTAAFKAFDGILAAAEKGLGWIPKLGGKIKGARAAFNEFSDSTVGKLKTVENALIRARDKANELGRDRKATITITTVYATRNAAAEATPGRGPEYDTSIPGGKSGRGLIAGGRRSNQTQHTSSRALIAPRYMAAPSDDSVIDQLGSLDDVDVMVGPGSGGTTVIQLVVDRKVLAEAVLAEVDSKAARS